MKNNSYLLVLMLVLGIFLGKEIFSTSGDIPVFSNQLNSVLDQIEYLYVDTVDRRSLEEAAVEAIVNELDPHSVYFDAEEIQAMAEPMEGGFEGIGIEFLITNDTLMVVTALPGGPSEGAGCALCGGACGPGQHLDRIPRGGRIL